MTTSVMTMAPAASQAAMTSDEHMMRTINAGRAWNFPSGPDMPPQPAQPIVQLPTQKHVTNQYSVFVPHTGNNSMLQFRSAPQGTPYGKQDPVQEAVIKLAEMGVKSSRVRSSKPKEVKPKGKSIFHVPSK